MKIYVNKETGALAVLCCGELGDASFKELKANTTDGAQEKHVPVVEVKGDTVSVCVGSVPHPMTAEHSITFIVLETSEGYQVHKLPYTGEPKTEFKLASGEKAKAVYEYCNLHGLWCVEL
ncbi:MAG: desulfoferrodoxin [Clostridia bacterium]|jgi:superoxide reductase|nr:desulfoferrodoxin [Clostridia bacterium]